MLDFIALVLQLVAYFAVASVLLAAALIAVNERLRL